MYVGLHVCLYVRMVCEYVMYVSGYEFMYGIMLPDVCLSLQNGIIESINLVFSVRPQS